MFAAYTSGTNRLRITFASEKIQLFGEVSGSSVEAATTAVYRDYSAWYHIVVALDTTQATNTNRIKVYVNGVQVTSFSATTYPSQNADLEINNNSGHYIGQRGDSDDYFNGYLTEINFIDGQALDATYFGMTDPVTGAWIPKAYNGTYGTNGFYLNFSNNASTAALGTDYSGNSNTWTTNNFSVTAGAGNDSLTDVPTPWIAYNTTGDVGGVVRGNYCTLNPLTLYGGNSVCQNGNLYLTASTSGDGSVKGTIAMKAGEKYYFEAIYNEVGGSGGQATLGITSNLSTGAFSKPGSSAGEFAFDFRGSAGTPQAKDEGSLTTYGTQPNNGDVVGIAVDLSTGKFYAHKANSYYNSGDPVSGTGAVITGIPTDLDYLPHIGLDGGVNNNDWVLNFGQRPFEYTPPAGFLSLCTTNLPTPTILDGGDYFNTVLWTGTGSGSTRAISGVGFQPDFVWAKVRSAAYSHSLYDVIRGGGANAELSSDSTNAEGGGNNDEYGYLSSFDSDGFTSTAGTQGAANNLYFNESGETYVAWNWKAGGTPAVTNTDGTITSSISVNTTSGFSIVTYTGTGANATVGHGLGVAPAMVIVKNRDAADAWQVYHAANTANPETDYLVLNTTAATADAADRWNDTLPTSTVFSIGDGVEVNTNTEDYVAYVFAQIPGYSAFGSYTGNGSADGPFVYTGFRPAFVLIKGYDAVLRWRIIDSTRDAYNDSGADLELFPNLSNAEESYVDVDFLSNGFKFRNTDGGANGSGNNYIYAAFAENPFKYSNAR
jgi:hypothetical protein